MVEFTHESRRYRAEIRPVPDGGPEFADGAWFVSVDGGPPRRVFEVHPDDANDAAAFQHRLLIATWLAEGWERRVAGERRKAQRDAATRDRRHPLGLLRLERK